ncbi:MAG: cyclic nucleotide-binding domain-containing protein [Polyangiaceae bacterium]|nr:cyclic nucleotide-binding domain-containing protein [Polyangiaceae bacterium]
MKAGSDATARAERELFVRTRLARLTEPGLGSLAARLAHEVIFAPGQVIYREGDPPTDFYAFLRGQIEVITNDLPPWILRDQGGVGLIDVLAEKPRNATVVAYSNVKAMRIAAHDYLDFLEEHFELALESALRAAQDVHDLSVILAPDGGFRPLDVPPVIASAPNPFTLVQKIEALQKARVFRKANVQSLVKLAMIAHEVHFDAEEVVFHRGAASGRFYLVGQGVVEASLAEHHLTARFGEGDVVCGYGALGAADNQYVAVARTPAIVFWFSEEDFFDVMEEHFSLCRSVLAAIAADYTRLVLERERRAALAASSNASIA